MTDVSEVTTKPEKKKTVANPVKSEKTLLKDAKERIMRLQKKTSKNPAKKGGAAVKKIKIPKMKINRRGVVYLGHIPHGFYEEELRGFFSQFGKVSRVKVSRSPKTGKSKGYAFIEFAFNDVAKIVAETMNNYLMFERLVKAQYIPPEKVHSKMFPVRFMTAESYPTLSRKNRLMAKQEKPATEKDKQKHRGRILFKVTRAMSALKEMGIDHHPQIYDPEAGQSVNNDAPETSVDEIPQLVEIQPAITVSKLSKKMLKASKRNSTAVAVKLPIDSTPIKVDEVSKSVIVQPSKPENSSPKLTRNQRRNAQKQKMSNAEGNPVSGVNLTSDSATGDTPSQSPNKRLKQSTKSPAKSVATPLKKNSETIVKASPKPVEVSTKASPKPDSKKTKAKTFSKDVAASSKLPIRSAKGKKSV